MSRLKGKCEELIEKADEVSKDKWYKYSLEDMVEDMEKVLQEPASIEEADVKQFRQRLEGIEKDFLRKPLLQKPSFFAVLNDRVKDTAMALNTEVSLLPHTTLPLLGAGYIPPAIGN